MISISMTCEGSYFRQIVSCRKFKMLLNTKSAKIREFLFFTVHVYISLKQRDWISKECEKKREKEKERGRERERKSERGEREKDLYVL